MIIPYKDLTVNITLLLTFTSAFRGQTITFDTFIGVALHSVLVNNCFVISMCAILTVVCAGCKMTSAK